MQPVFPAHIYSQNGVFVQSCQEHSRNAAAYAARSLASVGLSSSAYLAGLLHDLGKCKPQFKKYLEDQLAGSGTPRGSVIHTFAGVKYLLSYHGRWAERMEDVVSEMLSYAVGAHHGLFDCVNENRENGFLHRLEREPPGDADALRNFHECCADEAELQELFEKATAELTPLLTRYGQLADDDEILFSWGMIIRLLTSAVMEGDRRDTAEFKGGATFPAEGDPTLWKTLLARMESKLAALPADTPINAARRTISQICRSAAERPSGIFRLNVPTGGGKTLSALRFALAHAEKYGKKRIIFTSPLLSILDQNSGVIQDFVGKEFVFEHHSNVVQERASSESNEQYALLADSWSSPIIVTTLVQLLNTMLDGKSSSVRRFHALTDAVIVIDEVQTVPGKMLSLFNLIISFLAESCHTTVLLCSATQPCLESIAHPIRGPGDDVVPYQPELWRVFKRTDIRFAGGYRLQEVPSVAEEILEETSSLLIVCNKKSESEAVYHALASRGYAVFHLSAAMCMEHRRQTLAAIQASLECTEVKTVCVATQVIEAGVDISFGAVIRFTAGLDSIIQAAGRCNRNGGKDGLGQVRILRITDENLSHLREIRLAQQATDVLLDAFTGSPEMFDSDLSSAAAVAYYYRQLFATQRQDHAVYHDYPVEGGTSLLDLLSRNSDWLGENDDGPMSFVFHQAFASAGRMFEVFDSDTTDVIVSWGEGETIVAELLSEKAKHDLRYVKEKLRQGRAYTVSLYAWQKKRLEECGALIPLANGLALGLAPDYYHHCTGVQMNTEKEENRECNTLIW